MPGTEEGETDDRSRDLAAERANKDRVRAAFDEWAAGTGGPFALLAEDATWTIVGNSPVSRKYSSRKDFIDVVIDPFNARLSAPLVPNVQAFHANGDWVIALFDTIEFADFWNRVSPA